MINKTTKVYLIALESNTGTDRVVMNYFNILSKLDGIDVELVLPIARSLEKVRSAPFRRIITKLVKFRPIAYAIEEYFLAQRIKQNSDNYCKIVVVTLVYPLIGGFLFSLIYKKKIQYFFWIPDLMYKKNYVKNWRWRIFGALVDRSVKHASKILVPSASSYADIYAYYGASVRNKTERLEGPIDYSYFEALKSEPVDILNGKNFIFHPGGNKPSKNLDRCVEAFKEMGLEDLYFIYIENGVNSNLNSHARENRKNVLALKGIKDENMKWLYENSKIVSIVSLEEGIGLPLLEAQITNSMIVTSNISAMPEVSEMKALYANPYDVSDIKARYVQALEETNKKKISKVTKPIYGKNIIYQLSKIFT